MVSLQVVDKLRGKAAEKIEVWELECDMSLAWVGAPVSEAAGESEGTRAVKSTVSLLPGTKTPRKSKNDEIRRASRGL
jgi:hypothetical protein